MGAPRAIVLAAWVALAAGQAIVPAGAASAPACPGQVVKASASWTAIRAPLFPASTADPVSGRTQAIKSYAVDASDPKRIYVTNQTVIMRSLDGGCSWSLAYDSAAPGGNLWGVWAGTGVLHNRIYTLQSRASIYTTHVMVSDDFGKTWKDTSIGTAIVGIPWSFAISPSDPKTLYLETSYLGFNIFTVSHDSGETWTPQPGANGRLGAAATGYQLDKFVVDPSTPTTLWSWTSAGTALVRSESSGLTWASVGEAKPTTVDIARGRTGATRVITVEAATSASTMLRRSDDGGKTLKSLSGPLGNVSALGHSAFAPECLMTVGVFQKPGANPKTIVSRYSPSRKRWIDVTFIDSFAPASGTTYDTITSADGVAGGIYLRSDAALWKYTGPLS